MGAIRFPTTATESGPRVAREDRAGGGDFECLHVEGEQSRGNGRGGIDEPWRHRLPDSSPAVAGGMARYQGGSAGSTVQGRGGLVGRIGTCVSPRCRSGPPALGERFVRPYSPAGSHRALWRAG